MACYIFPLAGHIICVLIIALLGIFGNGLVLMAHLNKNIFEKKTYFIPVLAVLDIIACIGCAPQFAILDIDCNNFSITTRVIILWEFFILLRFLILSNLGILSTVALDRVWAVYSPIDYAKTKASRYQVQAVFTLLVSLVAAAVSTANWSPLATAIYSSIIGFCIVCCFIILAVSYIAIAVKLFKMKRKVDVNLMPQKSGTPMEQTNNQQNISRVPPKAPVAWG